jgi:hypothetical protein
MPIDIERARPDTPAASHVLHFNNAGAALMPAPVLAAQLRHLELEAPKPAAMRPPLRPMIGLRRSTIPSRGC